MGKKEFFIDLDECTGCNLCMIACKDEHVGNSHMPYTKEQPDTGHFWMNVKGMERGQVPKVRVTYLPLLCQHCDNAPCMKACPENAIIKGEKGLVIIDQEKCTGCGLCQEACPYDVIYMNEDLNVAQKCTGCAHLVEKGETPRCADICPRDAIYFGEEDDPKMIRLKAKAEALHPEFGAKPKVYYKGLPKPFISGILVDQDEEEIVQGASIKAQDLFNDQEYSATSDEFGDFWLRNLEIGHKYLLTVEASGYGKLIKVVTADKDRNIGELSLKRKRNNLEIQSKSVVP